RSDFQDCFSGSGDERFLFFPSVRRQIWVEPPGSNAIPPRVPFDQGALRDVLTRGGVRVERLGDLVAANSASLLAAASPPLPLERSLDVLVIRADVVRLRKLC